MTSDQPNNKTEDLKDSAKSATSTLVDSGKKKTIFYLLLLIIAALILIGLFIFTKASPKSDEQKVVEDQTEEKTIDFCESGVLLNWNAETGSASDTMRILYSMPGAQAPTADLVFDGNSTCILSVKGEGACDIDELKKIIEFNVTIRGSRLNNDLYQTKVLVDTLQYHGAFSTDDDTAICQ